METERSCQGLSRVGGMGVITKGYRLCFWRDNAALKLDYSDGCATL